MEFQKSDNRTEKGRVINHQSSIKWAALHATESVEQMHSVPSVGASVLKKKPLLATTDFASGLQPLARNARVGQLSLWIRAPNEFRLANSTPQPLRFKRAIAVFRRFSKMVFLSIYLFVTVKRLYMASRMF